jgi:hypothetical protein
VGAAVAGSLQVSLRDIRIARKVLRVTDNYRDVINSLEFYSTAVIRRLTGDPSVSQDVF